MTQICRKLTAARCCGRPVSVVLAFAFLLAACSGAEQIAARHSTEGFGSSTPPSDKYVAPGEPADQMGRF